MDPRMGCCIDVGHCVRAGTDVVQAIHAVGPRLFNMHMKDLDGFHDKESQVAVGEGIMPVRGIFQALQQSTIRASSISSTKSTPTIRCPASSPASLYARRSGRGYKERPLAHESRYPFRHARMFYHPIASDNFTRQSKSRRRQQRALRKLRQSSLSKPLDESFIKLRTRNGELCDWCQVRGGGRSRVRIVLPVSCHTTPTGPEAALRTGRARA